MRRKDCIVNCIGPDCEGCSKFQSRQTLSKEQLKEILLNYDKYCDSLVPSIRAAAEIRDKLINDYIKQLK